MSITTSCKTAKELRKLTQEIVKFWTTLQLLTIISKKLLRTNEKAQKTTKPRYKILKPTIPSTGKEVDHLALHMSQEKVEIVTVSLGNCWAVFFFFFLKLTIT